MRKFFLLFLAICLVSCASSNFESDFSPVYVTNTSKFSILPTNCMKDKIDGLQRMSANFGGQNFDLDVYVISDSSQLSMVILNEFGTTMGDLFYDGKSLEFNSMVFPKNIKSEYIVADFQFCLYEESSLNNALKNIGIDFIVSHEKDNEGKEKESRILSKNGKIISKITKCYENSSNFSGRNLLSIEYENFLRGYSYKLTEASK